MSWFFLKTGRFFGSRGFPKFLLWTITLIVFFYVEEDWRGAHAWAATRAEWEAKGVSFNPQSYYPSPIPDDQNLGAIPLFAPGPPPEPDQPYPRVLQAALRPQEVNELPVTGSLQHGELPNIATIKIGIAKSYAEAFPKSVLRRIQSINWRLSTRSFGIFGLPPPAGRSVPSHKIIPWPRIRFARRASRLTADHSVF